MSPDQTKILDDPHRILIVPAGTKTGKTVAASVWLLEGLLQGERVAWCGPWFKRTKTGWENIRNMLRQWEAAGAAKCRESDLSIVVNQTTTGREGVLVCYSGDNPDGIYGDAFDRFVIDEASRMPEGVFPAARSTLTATGGLMRVCFNIDRGTRHWSTRLFFDAKNGVEPSYGYVTMPTSRSPYVAREDVEQARRTLPERVFEALYNAVVTEDGAGVFVHPEWCVDGVLDKPYGTVVPPTFGHSYVIGVDLARKRDFTVVTVLDKKLRRLAYFNRFHGLEWHEQRAEIAAIAKAYNNARCWIDATGVGDPNIEELKRMGVLVEPYVFSAPSKRTAVERLAVAIEKREISYPYIDPLMKELGEYEYKQTPSGQLTYAGGGEHDDCVASLMLAVQGLGALRLKNATEFRMTCQKTLTSTGKFAAL